MNSLTISDATDEDRSWAASLMAKSEPWISLGRGYEECLQACQPGLETLFFVARTRDAPAGFAILRERGLAGSPYLAAIAVDQDIRSHGVGTQLLDYAEAFFRPRSRHIFLCVSSFNSRVRRFYENRGYKKVGELPDYIIAGADEILMHKRLDRP